jgi:hypothetical protein
MDDMLYMPDAVMPDALLAESLDDAAKMRAAPLTDRTKQA